MDFVCDGIWNLIPEMQNSDGPYDLELVERLQLGCQKLDVLCQEIVNRRSQPEPPAINSDRNIVSALGAAADESSAFPFIAAPVTNTQLAASADELADAEKRKAEEEASEAEARRLQAEGSPRHPVASLRHGAPIMIKEATNIGMLGQGSGPPPSIFMQSSQTLSSSLAALQGMVSSSVATLQTTAGFQASAPVIPPPSGAGSISVGAVVAGTPMELSLLKTAGRRGPDICYGDTVIVQCIHTGGHQPLWLLGSAYSGYVSWAAAKTLDPHGKAAHWVVQVGDFYTLLESARVETC